MITSSLYVHLQRPDNGEWITVGRYTLNRAQHNNERSTGQFVYAPSYIEAGHPWIIDPINLPRLDREVIYPAPRYDGMIDVLRDISPDAWGRLLLQKAYQLPHTAHEIDYLMHASNADRWGALTVSKTKSPNPASAACPKLAKLDELLEELQLMAEHKAPKYAALRNRLTKSSSLGGARPKATVQDGSDYWLVKPTIATDAVNTALFEYAAMSWGRRAKLNVAESRIYQDQARTAVLVKRFDRVGAQRQMVLSGASLLETEYPSGRNAGAQNLSRWSYPLLAQAMRRIGVPMTDLNELFGRMIFNAMSGNDDDHPRNHAVIWNESEQKWRLSPAFDIVPNLFDPPKQLAMQLSDTRWSINKEALMADWRYFGFDSIDSAEFYKRQIMAQIEGAAEGLETDGVSSDLARSLRAHMQNIIQLLT